MHRARLLLATLLPLTSALLRAPTTPFHPVQRAAVAVRRITPALCSQEERDPQLPPPPPPPPAKEDLDREFEEGVAYGKSMIKRFTSPRIDDPGLPLADSLVCLSACMFVSYVALLGFIPFPSWLTPPPGVPTEGWRGLPYILPTVSHGATLAACWLLGALASAAFERDAFMGSWQEALSRTWRGGAFAVGLLLLGTQATTSVALAERGLDPLVASEQADFLVLARLFEVITDVVVQAGALTAFRLYRWADAQGWR